MHAKVGVGVGLRAISLEIRPVTCWLGIGWLGNGPLAIHLVKLVTVSNSTATIRFHKSVNVYTYFDLNLFRVVRLVHSYTKLGRKEGVCKPQCVLFERSTYTDKRISGYYY